MIAAHGNSLRAIVKHLDEISDEDVAGVNIPTGIPLVYELERETSSPSRRAAPTWSEAEAKIAAVASQEKVSDAQAPASSVETSRGFAVRIGADMARLPTRRCAPLLPGGRAPERRVRHAPTFVLCRYGDGGVVLSFHTVWALYGSQLARMGVLSRKHPGVLPMSSKWSGGSARTTVLPRLKRS